MPAKLSILLQIVKLVSILLHIVDAIACTLMLVGWGLILWPLAFVSIKLHFWVINHISVCLGYALATWMESSGHKCYEVGEDISSCFEEHCLVLCNHQTSLDPILFIITFPQKKNVFDRTLWILDAWIKYTPFGIACWLRDDFFILQGKSGREMQKCLLESHLMRFNTPLGRRKQWIILYPEGGFLWKRRSGSQSFARQNDLPVLQHVTLPRMGAFETVLNCLHPSSKQDTDCQGIIKDFSKSWQKKQQLKWVIDVTVGYSTNKEFLPTFETLTLFPINPIKIFLHYRRFPIEQVPTDPGQMKSWLYSRFVEKEELLKSFYKTGAFSTQTATKDEAVICPKLIYFSKLRLAAGYLFIYSSLIMHYWLLNRFLALIF